MSLADARALHWMLNVGCWMFRSKGRGSCKKSNVARGAGRPSLCIAHEAGSTRVDGRPQPLEGVAISEDVEIDADVARLIQPFRVKGNRGRSEDRIGTAGIARDEMVDADALLGEGSGDTGEVGRRGRRWGGRHEPAAVHGQPSQTNGRDGAKGGRPRMTEHAARLAPPKPGLPADAPYASRWQRTRSSLAGSTLGFPEAFDRIRRWARRLWAGRSRRGRRPRCRRRGRRWNRR